jgi:hypothetical protein
MFICVLMYVCVRACLYVRTYLCAGVCVCVSVSVRAYLCAGVCVCV